MTKIIHSLIRLLLAISATILCAMMFLTATDVVMRYIFKLPISGAFELAEYMMAFIIPFSIAYCAEQKGHVSVELFFKKLPKYIQNTLDVVISVSTLIFAGLLTWQNILYVGETYRDHLASSVLLIPSYPFIVPVFIGAGAYTVIVALQMVPPHAKGRAK